MLSGRWLDVRNAPGAARGRRLLGLDRPLIAPPSPVRQQRNLDVLERTALDVSNPFHPSYGRHWSLEEIAGWARD